ncbi:MAG: NAD(P)/FAD-dependent oxidoreductase [Phenylobacterium sp.]|nr:NAD(P)/FAD-dependent oxidoreductase [Phenylobacterium sp.]
MGQKPQHDVVVIGAGFGGLYAAHRFREMGLDVLGLEKAADVGGVWYWNRYPGARCDCESYYYSYSFSEALQQDWSWSLRYSEQPEILDYLRHVADRFDLRGLYRFDSDVTAAHFDEADTLWRLRTARGEEITTRWLVTAMGCLSQVNWPDIPGVQNFEGRLLHTAQWPHEPVDFTGRRVGVIGTGASAVQAIPHIARQAAHLTVFQRTANWVLPAWNRPMDAEFETWVKANYGDIRARCLSSGGAVPFDPPERSAHEVSDQDRRATYDALWNQGGMKFFSAFTDLFTDEAANETAQAFVREHIARTIRDPETARRLTPNDHPIGVKRPPLDDDYYETFNRQNVSLADIRLDPIREIVGTTVRTGNDVHELDDLVVATGFDAITGALLAMDVRGRGGVRLQDRWADGARTYLGLGVAGFPNLFTVTGPLSPSVLANMPTAVEQHVDWIADCLDHMRRHGIVTLEATETAETAWIAASEAAVAHTLYPKANSWYFGTNIPGKPRSFGVYVGGFAHYREQCEAVARQGYQGFRLDAASN